jgi:nucleoside-diphosphate-sugar epimerase
LKILLTGATGFVGSHILDSLRSRNFDTAILVRANSNRRFVEHNIPWAEVRVGSFEEPGSLGRALAGITQVIHCAGATRAACTADFYAANQVATRRLLEAVATTQVQRLVAISSLAAAGPGTQSCARKETDVPNPVSEYGKSKLAGEAELKKLCRCEFVVLRPPAVYGPRDTEFLRLFRGVKSHLVPRSTQPLSLVYVKDLARIAVECLTAPNVAGRTFFVASPEVLTLTEMGRQLAGVMRTRVVQVPMTLPFLWMLCFMAQISGRIRGKPGVLSLQKYPELRAPGWVCDPHLLQRELGLECRTTFGEGAFQTLDWYRKQGWL